MHKMFWEKENNFYCLWRRKGTRTLLYAYWYRICSLNTSPVYYCQSDIVRWTIWWYFYGFFFPIYEYRQKLAKKLFNSPIPMFHIGYFLNCYRYCINILFDIILRTNNCFNWFSAKYTYICLTWLTYYYCFSIHRNYFNVMFIACSKQPTKKNELGRYNANVQK